MRRRRRSRRQRPQRWHLFGTFPCTNSRARLLAPPPTPHTPLDLVTRAAMTSPRRRRLDTRPLGGAGGRPQGRHLWPRRGVRGLEVSSSTATSRPPPPLPPPPPPPFCPSARLAPSTAPPLWSAGGGDCGRPRRGAVSPPAHRAPLRYYGSLWTTRSRENQDTVNDKYKR